MAELFTTLARAIASEVTRRADGDGNVPRSATFEIQQAAGQHVQRLFLGRNQRGELAPFDTLINGAVIPLSPYMRQLWESIRAAVRIPVEQNAVILTNKLPADVLSVMRGAVRNPFVVAKGENRTDRTNETYMSYGSYKSYNLVSEQVFRPNPLAVYDAPHEWVDPNGYRLSDRVWNSAGMTRRHLDLYLDTAIREGRGALQMSRELERFLVPGRTLTTNKPYSTNASYDAMRLARTEISQASQRAHIASAAMNPFVAGMKWNLSASHPRYDICDELAKGGPNGDGVYEIATYPSRPHPQCLCYSTNVMVDTATSDSLIDELRLDIQSARQEFVNLVGPVQVEAFERLLLGQGLTIERSGLGAVSRVIVSPVVPVVPAVAPVVPVAPPAIPPAQLARRRIAEIEQASRARLAQVDAEIERVRKVLSDLSLNMDKLEQSLAKRAGTPQEAQIRAALDRQKAARRGLFDERRALRIERDVIEQERIIRTRGAVQVDRPARLTMNATGIDDAVRRHWQRSTDEFSRLVSADVAPMRPVEFRELANGRAHYDPNTRAVNVAATTREDTVVHELGHWLDNHSPEVQRKVTAFYNRRTQGYALEPLGAGFDASEMTRRDKFLDPYMGKIYSDGATEIVSMGAEYFYNQTARMAMEDPDMFDFIFNLLRGL